MSLENLVESWAEDRRDFDQWMEILKRKNIRSLRALITKANDSKGWKALIDSFPDDPADVQSLLKSYLLAWKQEQEKEERKKRPAEDQQMITIGVQRMKFSHETMMRTESLSSNLKALSSIKEIIDQPFFKLESGFPYPADLELKVLYLRQCYADVFEVILNHISKTKKFAISGTTESWHPQKVVYHHGTELFYIDIGKQEIFKMKGLFAEGIVELCDLYIIDGICPHPINTAAPTIFIASPRADTYREYVKQKKALQFCFPVWEMSELERCRIICYPEVSKQALQARYEIYGGVARILFGQHIFKPNQLVSMVQMDGALSNSEAVNAIRVVREPTAIHKESHTLIHCNSGEQDGIPYQFVDACLASKYVGMQLWKNYHKEMAVKLQEFLGGSDSELSRRLFEIYMHLILQGGNISLKCRNLKTGCDEPDFMLTSAFKESRSLKNNELPSEFEEGIYYEGCNNLPCIDAVIPGVGIIQATICANHPLKVLRLFDKFVRYLRSKFRITSILQRVETKKI